MPQEIGNQSKSLFIVLSVIYFKDRALSYSATRSAFSPEKRAEQTMKTIESIRDKVPSAKILLVEFGHRKDLPFGIENLVDEYLYLGDIRLMQFARDSKNKGFGEALALYYTSKIIEGRAPLYFKISGRYFLDDDFSIENFDSGQFCFLAYGNSVSTRLYSFGNSEIGAWRRALLKSLPFLFLFGVSIESTLSFFVKKNVKRLKRLGVSGFIAPNAEYFSE
jgi:hypothetical protein